MHTFFVCLSRIKFLRAFLILLNSEWTNECRSWNECWIGHHRTRPLNTMTNDDQPNLGLSSPKNYFTQIWTQIGSFTQLVGSPLFRSKPRFKFDSYQKIKNRKRDLKLLRWYLSLVAFNKSSLGCSSPKSYQGITQKSCQTSRNQFCTSIYHFWSTNSLFLSLKWRYFHDHLYDESYSHAQI